MKSPDSLDALLTEARAGGSLDSEGSFTIAGEAAIGKLASFQLPRPSAWILKIIQGAVSSRASGLAICQSNESTTFLFYPSQEISVDDLRAALLSPQVPKEGAVAHIAIGLRAVGFGDKRAFTLALDQEETRTILGWNGSNLVQKVEHCEAVERPTIRVGVAFPPDNLGKAFLGLMKAKGRATDEFTECVQNAEACPIPLTFDGRRIDRLEAAPPNDVVGTSLSLSLGWRELRKDLPKFPRPLGVTTADPGWRPSDRFTDSRVFFLTGAPQQRYVNSIVRLRYRYHVDQHRSKNRGFKFHSIPQNSYFLWVKDGVICHRERAKGSIHAVSFDLYLPADDLPTDISGLTLRTSPMQTDRVRHGLEHLRWQIQETEAMLKSHLPKPFNFHSAVFGLMGVAGLVAAPATLGKSMIVGVAAINLAFSAYDKKEVLDDCIFHTGRLERQVASSLPYSLD